jgi:hypothetical protein
MKKLVSLILCLSLLLTGAALADTTISVQGQGAIRTNPDIAVITLGAETYGEDVAAIQASVNQTINNIIDTLTEEKGIEGKNIQTRDYSIYRRYYDDYGNVSREYVASCMLAITVTEVDKAGEIIDAAFAAGANTMGNVTFSVKNQEALSDEALKLAVQNAMRRAQVMAEAAGVTLPKLPSKITEGYDMSYTSSVSNRSMTEDAAMGASAKIMSGTVEITANVTVTYEIDD